MSPWSNGSTARACRVAAAARRPPGRARRGDAPRRRAGGRPDASDVGMMRRSANRVRAGVAAARRAARHRRPGRPPGRGRSRPAPARRGLPPSRPSPRRGPGSLDDDQTVGPARLAHGALQRQVARPEHQQRQVSGVDDVRGDAGRQRARHRRRPAPPTPPVPRPGLARRPPAGRRPGRREAELEPGAGRHGKTTQDVGRGGRCGQPLGQTWAPRAPAGRARWRLRRPGRPAAPRETPWPAARRGTR